jgi:tRNA-2-methylthio-N6-dimethylallyladenosine synthase
MPFVHLPVQSGSDRILAAMNRKHGRDEYLRIIERFRNARADIAFSSDFIVGFPGEQDKDFEDTLDLIRQVNFAQAYSFKYSPRPGTPASSMAVQVAEDVRDARLSVLQELLWKQQRAYNDASVGTTVPVLLDRVGHRAGQLGGRTPHMQSVYVESGAAMLGQIVQAEITEAGQTALKAVCR